MVLLNGRSVNFFVEVNTVAATCCVFSPPFFSPSSPQHDSDCRELFQQVVSYQSLGEQHVFGLAVVRGTLTLAYLHSMCCITD